MNQTENNSNTTTGDDNALRDAQVTEAHNDAIEVSGVPLPFGPPEDDKEWRRVHRATPFIRGWLIIVAIIFGGLNSFSGSFTNDEGSMEFAKWELLGLAGVGLVALIIAIVYGYFAWRRMRFAYDDESVYMNTGILFRQERKIRLDRIQSIDIVKPLFARIFGLAELTLTSASGGDANVAIGFLKEEEANNLRIEILARASGVAAQRKALAAQASAGTVNSGLHGQQTDSPQLSGAQGDSSLTDGAHAPSHLGAAGPTPSLQTQGIVGNQEPQLQDLPERVIYQVPPTRIILGSLLTASTIIAVLFVLAIVVLFAVGQRGIAFSLLPALLGVGPVAVNRILGEFGFTGAISPDGIRVRHGLLETRSKTIPPGRVQAVRIRQGLLWRKLGWWRVDVNVAGQVVDASGSSITLEAVLLPVGTSVEAIDALWLVLPDLGVENPLAVLDAAMTGSGSDQGFITSPRSAKWVDPLSYKRNGYLVTDRAVIIRTGWLTRNIVVVPHERVQSIGVKQGPMQRKLEVASLSIHSTVGAISPQIPHLANERARTLLAEQSARAASARVHAGPERWLQQVAELSQDDNAGSSFGQGALLTEAVPADPIQQVDTDPIQPVTPIQQADTDPIQPLAPPVATTTQTTDPEGK